MLHHWAYKLFIISLLIVLTGCASDKSNANYTAEDNLIKEAQLVSIELKDSCYIARVIDKPDAAKPLGIYIFPQSETAATPDIAGAVILRPSQLKNLMVYSSVHAGAMNELGALDAIKIVGDADYFSLDEIQQRLKTGRVIDGGAQQLPVKERILQSSPGAIIVSYYQGMDISALKQLGIPIIYIAESAEQTPLGRAEWIKLIGLISGNYAASDSIYSDVSTRYKKLVKEAEAIKGKRPKVLTEMMFEGVWNVAGGKSYAAQMIADAGGDYAWADNGDSGSLNLSLEAILAKAKDADVWLVRVFNREITPESLAQSDERYLLFDAARKENPAKNIWFCDTGKSPFYVETPFHPDRLLADYIAIFHPENFADYSPRYFKKMKK